MACRLHPADMCAPIVRREACSRRFGGLEFVPPVISVRGYGSAWTSSNLSVNQARYNDFVPMVYGTAWYEPLVVFARNDGNLTRMEVLLGIGLMQGVVTVLVNDVQIPIGVSGTKHDGDRMVQRSYAGIAGWRVRHEFHGLRAGSRRAIPMAAWRISRLWCRTN